MAIFNTHLKNIAFHMIKSPIVVNVIILIKIVVVVNTIILNNVISLMNPNNQNINSVYLSMKSIL